MPKATEQPLNAATRYCAVLGHPIRHSASPAMQNAGINALGLNWRYLAHEVFPEELPVVIAGLKASHYIGLNLTVPHKLLAMKLVDVRDESAEKWGAVNTIVFEGLDLQGKWLPLRFFKDSVPSKIRSHGFNTDADAIGRSLREDLGVKLKGKRVMLLGAGGAGRTAALKLASEGVKELYIFNRTWAKGSLMAELVQQQFPEVKVILGYPNPDEMALDLLLNATSRGLKPGDGSPFDEQIFPLTRVRAVYDMIYRPAQTELLRAAKKAGCKTANGLGMLLYQGAKALELWTGKKAPVEIMRKALEKNIYAA
ncbi:MAG TPA: shikimate dehydrogenase [Verrucomicrobiae bacterium]|nr:shikimate dehydrogenase [Verrucomicrobiae bacterium]